MLEGNILITGGSGFLGRAILRRARFEAWPARFTVLSRHEESQWKLRAEYPEVRFVLGDVAAGNDSLTALMAGHRYVIHAAALKHIPEAEENVFTCIATNVDGSRNVAFAAARAGVERVVGISTDKACAPANTYGLTKALMEKLFVEANRLGATEFSTVRYGNVIGSTGSVVPLFRRQIATSGRVSITDPSMTRFWLSPDDAVDLVVRALTWDEPTGARGLVHIGRSPALSLIDLAEAVWNEAGRERPVAIDIIGIRPGEKLAEELYNEQESSHVSMLPVNVENVSMPANDAFVLYPATWREPVPFRTPKVSYSSAEPARWLGVGEFRGLMRDAESI